MCNFVVRSPFSNTKVNYFKITFLSSSLSQLVLPFRRVIADGDAADNLRHTHDLVHRKDVRKLLLCSGKVSFAIPFFTLSLNQGAWPCCGHFQLHNKFWRLDRIGNSLIWIAIAMNHEDCHFKSQWWSRGAKVIRDQSEDPLSLEVIA